MTRETKTKTLHYRYAHFLQGGGNLQQLLGRSLTKRAMVEDRLERFTPSGNELRVINNHPRQNGMQFGNLLYFERGTNRILLSTDAKVPELDVAQIAPPALHGKPSEFLDAIMYFGVLGNHVILLQSNALTSKHLEFHLNWLLVEAGVMPEEGRVELIDSAKPAIRQAIEKRPVKKVRFGSPFLDLNVSADEERKTTRTEKMRVTPQGMGPAILKAVLGEVGFSKLHLEDALDGNLRVALEITYDRTTTDGGERALRSIARALRHVDEEEVALKIPGLGTVKGADLKISDSVRIDSYNGMLDQNQIFPEMHEWLSHLLDQNIVSDQDV